MSTLVCPCVRVHRRTSFISSFLLYQQSAACLVRFTWMVCEMGGKWSYSCCFVEYLYQDWFKTACCKIVKLPSKVWKLSRFISSERSDFHMINNLSIAVYTESDVNIRLGKSRMLTSLSVNEILLSRYLNWSAYFRKEPFPRSIFNYISKAVLFSYSSTFFRISHCFEVFNRF